MSTKCFLFWHHTLALFLTLTTTIRAASADSLQQNCEAPSFFATAAANVPNFEPFRKLKYGFFVHYVWAGAYGRLTIDKAGKGPDNLDAFADAFDVQGFANDLSDWGVEYVVFTAWHANINPLFPSETMKKWGMEKRTLAGHSGGTISANRPLA